MIEHLTCLELQRGLHITRALQPLRLRLPRVLARARLTLERAEGSHGLVPRALRHAQLAHEHQARHTQLFELHVQSARLRLQALQLPRSSHGRRLGHLAAICERARNLVALPARRPELFLQPVRPAGERTEFALRVSVRALLLGEPALELRDRLARRIQQASELLGDGRLGARAGR